MQPLNRRRIEQRALRAIALPCALAAAEVSGQMPPGLDKGHRILLQRGFQIHAMAVDQPEVPNWGVFDAGGWNGVDFQFNYFGPAAYLGAAPGNHLWQATYADYSHTSFTQVEAPYASNCVRIQLLDEQDLNDATVRANTANWFAAARANYPDTILSINQIPFAATDANFRNFMQTSQPDMLMIDSYRWTTDPSQGSWHLYSDWQRHRKFALSGNDGTGAHPIPYGFYAQAIDDFPPGSGRVPSESELRLEHFGAWAMGYTMTDDFTYNTNHSYSGVESIFFVNGSQQANPTASYYQVQELNRQGKNLGPALVRLLSTDVRFVAGRNSSGAINPNPIDIPNWTQGAGDPYLRSFLVANIGTKNNGYAGDALLTWSKVLDESLDGTDFSNEIYFTVTNGLTDPTGSAANCRQRITLNYDFGASGSITAVQRLSRDTGQVEEIFLPFAPGGGLQRQLTIDLDGGTTDLFKFRDGAGFVGATTPTPSPAYWDADGNAGGNDITSGAGLGGSGNWDASSRWFNGASDASWGAGNNAVFTGAAGTVTLTAPQSVNNVTFKTTGYTLAGATLTLSGAATVTVDTGVFTTISSVVAGGFGLIKSGTGTLNLTAANSYSGGTIVNGGVLAIAGDSSLGAAPATPTTNLVLNGALLRFNGNTSLQASRMIYLGSGGATIDTIANKVTIAGQISGSSSLTKAGSGTLELTSSNTYSGGNLVLGGALQIASDASLGAVPSSFTAGNITLDNATLQFGQNLEIGSNRGLTINANGGAIDTQTFSNSGGYGAAGGFQGSGNLTKLGSGTFLCTSTTSNNSWTGSLILKEGVWKTTSRGGFPINPTAGGLRAAQTIFDGGTLQFAATFFASEPNRGITINAGGGVIDTQGYSITWAGPIAGTSAAAMLTKMGGGTLRLNSSSVAGSYAGETRIAAGTLQLAGGTALGDLSAVSLDDVSGATLSLANSETIGSLAGGGGSGGTVSLGSATLTVGGNNRSTTFSGVISGVGGKLTKNGSGAMTLAAVNAYTGATAVNGGALILAASQTSSASLAIAGGARAELASGMNKLLKTQSASIAAGGKLDVKDNKLILTAASGGIGSWNGSAYTGVTGLIQSGRGDGSWNGSGMVTSMSDATTSVLTTLAVALAEETPHAGGTFGGVSVTFGDTLVMYTWGGDADLNGELNGDDYFYIDSNALNNGSVFGFHKGDFNYDGAINGDDYFIIDSNITYAQNSPPFPTGAGGGPLAAVPEPGALTCAMVTAISLLRRRRRKPA